MALPAFVIPLLKIIGTAAAGAAANKATQQDQIGPGMDMQQGDDAQMQSLVQGLVKPKPQIQQQPIQPLTYDLLRRNQ